MSSTGRTMDWVMLKMRSDSFIVQSSNTALAVFHHVDQHHAIESRLDSLLGQSVYFKPVTRHPAEVKYDLARG